MITFEQIITEKDKTKRDLLIKEKLDELNNTTEGIYIDTNSIMTGFISNKSSVKFSDYHFDMNIGLGSIYEMKADDYFYEFIDFLVERNYELKKDAIRYVSSFLQRYFDERGKKDYSREVIFDDIWNKLAKMYDEDIEKFNRCKPNWLDIGVFKGLSAAECTEYAALTQNLLTFCDIDCCYVSGHMKNKESNEDHAFNTYKLDEEYYLIDPANPICLFDEQGNYAGCTAYTFKVDATKLSNFMLNKEPIEYIRLNYMKTKEDTKPVDKQICTYTTQSRLINEDEINKFLATSNRKL